MRTFLMSVGVTALLSSSLLMVGDRDAAACGGCFHPPPPPTETVSTITDHRMVLSISPTQSTLYDQIRYTGSPSEFAWVLPIHGAVTVGLSSDVLFGTLDALTTTQIQAPPDGCPAAPTCGNQSFGASGAPAPGNATDLGGGGVTVTKQQVVGPYETVQLHSTDASALNNWLTSHSYSVPDDVAPIIAAYVAGQFDFLAMRLTPGQGVQSMRPVRVTSTGASAVLPLRMVAAGTGATVGITLWVVADGRYEPQNFPFFHIEDSELVWDWPSSSSNYTTLRAAKEQALGGSGWEVESSIALAESQIQNFVLNGGVQFGGGPTGSNAAADYAPIATSDAGTGETPEQVRQDDLTTLFSGMAAVGGQVRTTRLRADLAHAALIQDLALTASMDQAELSNHRKATKESGEPLCAVYGANCQQVGQVPRSQALSAAKSSFSCATSRARWTSDAASPGVFASVGAFAGAFGIFIAAVRRRRGASQK